MNKAAVILNLRQHFDDNPPPTKGLRLQIEKEMQILLMLWVIDRKLKWVWTGK